MLTLSPAPHIHCGDTVKGKMLDVVIALLPAAGFGIYHPFNDDAFFYPEYYLSAGINCFDFFKAKLSTEYTDQIFKHQAAVDVNVRLVEIECGVSFQSTDFLKSMNVTGIGAYVVTSIGF